MHHRYLTAVAALAFAVGCSVQNPDHFDMDLPSPPQGSFVGGGIVGGGIVGAGGATAGDDNRPVVTAATVPPPISGGTLAITMDGVAVAADPDRDRVSIVDLATQTILYTIALKAGDEPGRVALDDAGLAHVALRRGGAIVSIDLSSGAIVSRRAICGAPRGIAYEASTKLLHVACADGTLVSLPAAGGAATRTLNLGPDLRDVLVEPNGLAVSRFKAAALTPIDAQGNAQTPLTVGSIKRSSLTPDHLAPQSLAADGAWRTRLAPNGDIYMLHQYALSDVIKLNSSGADGGVFGSPYAATSPCSGLVQEAVTRIDSQGQLHAGAPLQAPLLGVDMDVSTDGAWLAIAQAGLVDPNQNESDSLGPPSPLTSVGGAVTIIGTSAIQTPSSSASCATPSGVLDVPGQVTAVAFNPNASSSSQSVAWLVAQSREPAMLFVFAQGWDQSPSVSISLGGASMADTGHDIFHRDTGSGIACASCHLEGHEDGHVWNFDPQGARRTQAIDIGLSGTAPFHWDGDIADFTNLMSQVFVHRMGGPIESTDRVQAVQNWVFSLRELPPLVDPSSASALRGQALFQSTAGCTTCHSGAKMTNDQNMFVGTTAMGVALQVPSLIGVGYRAPFLHDGRAATLQDRFDPSIGGGTLHGNTAGLSAADVSDLVSYLESL